MTEQTQPDSEKPVPAVVSKSKSGRKVTVACKMPNGLLLRIFRMVESTEPVMGGGRRVVKVAQQYGPEVKINGYAAPHGMSPNSQVIGGYALTPNVDADFFEKWLKDNAESDYVIRGLVFAHEKQDDVDGQAKEQAKVRNGLEPINPDPAAKDPRMPRGIKTAKLTGNDSDMAA